MENIIRPLRKGGRLPGALCAASPPPATWAGTESGSCRQHRKAWGEGRLLGSCTQWPRRPESGPQGGCGSLVTRILTPAPALGEEGTFVLTKKIKWKQEEAPPGGGFHSALPLGGPRSPEVAGRSGGSVAPLPSGRNRSPPVPAQCPSRPWTLESPGVSGGRLGQEAPSAGRPEVPKTGTSVTHGQEADAPNARSPPRWHPAQYASGAKTRGDSQEAPPLAPHLAIKLDLFSVPSRRQRPGTGRQRWTRCGRCP